MFMLNMHSDELRKLVWSLNTSARGARRGDSFISFNWIKNWTENCLLEFFS